MALCTKHYHALHRQVSNRRKNWTPDQVLQTPDQVLQLNKLFEGAIEFRKASLTQLTPLLKIRKQHAENPEHPTKNLPDSTSSSSNDCGDEKEEHATLQTPPKKKRRGSSTKLRRSPRLKKAQLLQAGIDSGMSGRQLERHADSLRGQQSRGDNSLNVPSGSAIRKDRSKLGKVFLQDFEYVETTSWAEST